MRDDELIEFQDIELEPGLQELVGKTIGKIRAAFKSKKVQATFKDARDEDE